MARLGLRVKTVQLPLEQMSEGMAKLVGEVRQEIERRREDQARAQREMHERTQQQLRIQEERRAAEEKELDRRLVAIRASAQAEAVRRDAERQEKQKGARAALKSDAEQRRAQKAEQRRLEQQRFLPKRRERRND